MPDAISHMQRIGKHLPVASVAGGFPSGQYPLCSRLMEVKWAVEVGAAEIDVVIDRAAALEGNWEGKTCLRTHTRDGSISVSSYLRRVEADEGAMRIEIPPQGDHSSGRFG